METEFIALYSSTMERIVRQTHTEPWIEKPGGKRELQRTLKDE
jgi:hypothetical protein